MQIENELYDIIRPKRAGPSGSRPATLLKESGIEYLELRGIDVNPFIPEGIDANKMKLLDIYIIHSLISESPFISRDEIEEIKVNQRVMVRNGRAKDVRLIRNGVLVPLSEIRNIYLDELEQTAKALEDSIIIFVSIKEFEKKLEDSDMIIRGVMAILSERLRDLQKRR